MPTTDENTDRNRVLTDDSLSAERTKADSELAARAERLQEDSDAVIKQARERAAVVLQAARVRADAASAGKGPVEGKRVAQERAQDDGDRAAERTASDVMLAAERELRRQALAELLAEERRITDGALEHERMLADDSQQRREDMFAIVSHDFLNLVNTVAMGAATIVEDADEGDARGQRIIRRADAIRRATLRMQQVVNSLLDVASIEAGMLHLDRRAEDAARVVREVVLLFEPVAAAHGLSITGDIGATPLRALFDPPRLSQVLTNLLTNAIKFTSTPGAVSVQVSRAGSDIEFAVSDTGCGIPADQHTTIFERFSRAHSTRAAGHGLGLYICRQLVEGHGGQLTVESEVGRGSTFRFRIAAVDADALPGDIRT